MLGVLAEEGGRLELLDGLAAQGVIAKRQGWGELGLR